MDSQSVLKNFLSLSLDQLYHWIEKSYQSNLTGGFDNDTSKSMLEQEILYWIDENNQPVEVETELFDFLDSLDRR